MVTPFSRRAFVGGAGAVLGLTSTPLRTQMGRAKSTPFQLDLDELYERLKNAHFNLYANRSSSDYDKEYRQLRAKLGEVSNPDQAARNLQRFVAFGRIAHARIGDAANAFRAFRKSGGKIFPLTLRVRNGRLFVMINASGNDRLGAGDEVLSIEDRPAMQMIDSFWPELSADTSYMFHSMMEWELPRLLWQKLGTRSQYHLTVRTSGENPRRVTINALSQSAIGKANLKPLPLDASPTRRSYRMLGQGVAYIRPGPFYAVEQAERPYDNRAFVNFVDTAFNEFAKSKASRLIVDLRDNPGGDNSFSDHLISWFATKPFRFASSFKIKVSNEAVASNSARLAISGNDPTGVSAQLAKLYAGAQAGELVDFPIAVAQPRSEDRFTGAVFVLINRHSYSNAVNVAALIQDNRFGFIVGEETSDLATTLGAMEQFTLSRTGLTVGFPKAQIVRTSGSLERRGVVPDILIDFPVVETEDDPVLSQAIEAIMRA